MIHHILDELNESNSTNYKLKVLERNKDNDVLSRVLKMAYDVVEYSYGVSIKQVEKFTPNIVETYVDLEIALNSLEDNLASRALTGHAALQHVSDLLDALNEEDADIIRKVINRDLRINIGKTQINKVWKGLITKPSYMRCGVYNAKTSKDIPFPALLQLKADGTYREFNVQGSHVSSRSRSGEQYEYPIICSSMENYNDGIYTGELTVFLDNKLLEKIKHDLQLADKKNGTNDYQEILEEFLDYQNNGLIYTLPRAIGNGLINSDDVPHKNLILELWDFITHDEYEQAAKKDRKNPCQIPYMKRFSDLSLTLIDHPSDHIKLIPSDVVNNLKEALSITSGYMNAGYEGAVLKDYNGVFKDSTSKHQLKLKLEIELEVRITGFTEGSGKNADYFGAITFENDEGTIKGKVGVSSMKEKERDWFHEHREEVIGKIMTVQCNDLTKARGHKFYALSHPRYIEMRNEKDEADTLERAFELREMAMTLGAA